MTNNSKFFNHGPMSKILGIGHATANTNVGGVYFRTARGITHIQHFPDAIKIFGADIMDEPGSGAPQARRCAEKLKVLYEGRYDAARPELGYCRDVRVATIHDPQCRCGEPQSNHRPSNMVSPEVITIRWRTGGCPETGCQQFNAAPGQVIQKLLEGV